MGEFRSKKIHLIDETKHCIIKSVHPSPFSASNGFFGSKPFTKTNEYLASVNKEGVNWKIEDHCQQLSLLE